MSKTVSGELITIDDSAYDGMDDIVIYGKTVQNLIPHFKNSVSSGVTFTANTDGSFTLSGTSIGDYTVGQFSFYTVKPSTTYVFYVDKYVSSDSGVFVPTIAESYNGSWQSQYQVGKTTLVRIFTTSPELEHVDFAIVRSGTTGATVSGTYRVMLREATEAEIAAAASTPQTLPVYPDDSGPDASNDELGIMPLNDVSTLSDTFDDYWCPPGLSSIDNVEIVTAGNDLFYSGYYASGYAYGIPVFSFSGTKQIELPYKVSAAYSGVGRLAYCFAGVTYRIVFDNAPDDVFCGLNQIKNGETGASGTSSGTTGEYAQSVSKPNGHEFTLQKSGFVFVMCARTDNQYGYMFEKNFELRLEIVEQGCSDGCCAVQTPIDLQGHSLCSLPDGTRDELRIDKEGNVTLIKRVGEYVVDGTEGSATIAQSSNEAIEDYFVCRIFSDIPLLNNASYSGIRTCLSNKLAVGNPYSNNGYINCLFGCFDGANKYIGDEYRARLPNMETAEDYKSWFASNKVTIVVKKHEPETISLGKIDLPKLRKKPLVNNVWANGSAETTNFYLDTEMELTYRQWPGVRADGFKVSGKHNFWDFASCVASSDSGKPEKKFVTATVPYMSGFYDLSKIYGAIAYESRDVSYTFELLGADMEDLQRQKTNLLDWLGLVHDEPIYDDTQPNYHYVGSFYEADWEEDETGESGTLTVTFKCQPFLIADRATEESLSVGTHTVVNPGQQVSVFAKANSGSATVKINGVTQAVTTTEQRLTAQLQPGENEVVVTSNSVTLRYYERHL